jgi:segregation and condensation protein B
VSDETAPVETEHSAEEALRLIEALLFGSPEPLSEAVLAELLPAPQPVAELLLELQNFYRFRGINLHRIAGGWTFRTAPDLAPLLSTQRVEVRKLSRPQVETLAIIAYHQPVTRAEIEEIRGVSLSRGTLDLLIEAGWVAPQGRRDSPGQPILWGTTPGFLAHFGLNAIKELPRLEELRAAGLLDARPASVLGEAGGAENAPPRGEEEL